MAFDLREWLVIGTFACLTSIFLMFYLNIKESNIEPPKISEEVKEMWETWKKCG